MQEHGSTSSDAVNSPSNRLPDYLSLNPTSQEGENVSMWTVGGPSSSSGTNQENPGHIEPIPHHRWPVLKSRPEPPSSVLSLGDHGSSSSYFPDPFAPSSDPFELNPHHLSRKRKAAELSIGQSSSGVGSSNMVRMGDSSPWDTEPPSDQIIPRLGLSVGDHLGLENGHRNEDLSSNASSNDNRESNVSVLRLTPPTLNSTNPVHPVLRLPALRRNLQSSLRLNRTEPDSISDHPLFAPPSSIRTPSRSEVNWSGNDGGGNVITGGTGGATASRPVSSPSYHSRRLSAFLRRSLFSASDPDGGGGQNGNLFPRIPPGSSSQDVGVLPRYHQLPLSRMPPGSEGRGRLVSEIRNVLDLMRRGEPLQLEDLMILDQSVFYGVADINDRHRDMRLDIDNMSYEELLALEERIGNVNTGLTEETIIKHIRQKQFVVKTGHPDLEPCCVCQEEFKDGDDLGRLECGHEFHYGCIKQWLQHKNLCPICKSTGFEAST